MYQIHFGADYSKGTYGWTLNLDAIKKSVDKQLHDLKTDYIDYGFIHCQDESSDWQKYQKNGVLDYLLNMKEQGVVKHIGASSHTPSVIQEIMDTDLIDMLMFSVNPAYDYNHGDYAYGGVDERADVYKRCEKMGIGISVMKPFSGGQLLSAKTSPFGKALTQYRCIKYALDKPGILTVLPGAQSVEEVAHLRVNGGGVGACRRVRRPLYVATEAQAVLFAPSGIRAKARALLLEHVAAELLLSKELNVAPAHGIAHGMAPEVELLDACVREHLAHVEREALGVPSTCGALGESVPAIVEHVDRTDLRDALCGLCHALHRATVAGKAHEGALARAKHAVVQLYAVRCGEVAMLHDCS